MISSNSRDLDEDVITLKGTSTKCPTLYHHRNTTTTDIRRINDRIRDRLLINATSTAQTSAASLINVDIVGYDDDEEDEEDMEQVFRWNHCLIDYV